MVTRLEEETRIGKGGTLAGQLSRLDLVVSMSLDTCRSRSLSDLVQNTISPDSALRRTLA